MAKVPPVVAEEAPSRKRKADEVAAPADSAKKAKGDDVVTVSDDTTVAPSDPPTATEVAVKTKEGVSSPGIAETAPSGAGASARDLPPLYGQSGYSEWYHSIEPHAWGRRNGGRAVSRTHSGSSRICGRATAPRHAARSHLGISSP